MEGGDEFTRAWRQGDAGQDLVEDPDRQAPQRRDPLPQRLREIQFAAHRPFRDRGDEVAGVGVLRQQVDCLGRGQGGVHVQHHQTRRPLGEGTRDHPARGDLQESQAQPFRIVGLDDGTGHVTEGPRLPCGVEGQVDGFRVQGDQAGTHGVEGIPESERGGSFLPEAG